MVYLDGMESRFEHAAWKLLIAAKKLNKYLPEVSGNRDICDARRVIAHYEVRLKELGKAGEYQSHVQKFLGMVSENYGNKILSLVERKIKESLHCLSDVELFDVLGKAMDECCRDELKAFCDGREITSSSSSTGPTRS